jgi:hypothetical protein
MKNHEEERVGLVDPLSRIDPSSRDVGVVFNDLAAGAWPESVTGTIVGGLSNEEPKRLIPSPGNLPPELYIANRVTREGPRRRYVLADLQDEGPGRFRFKAVRDFDLSFQGQPQ